MDKSVKSYLNGMKFGTLGFLRSLIVNPNSKFRNTKWRIQYGGPKYKKLLEWDEIWYSGVFGVTDLSLKFKK